ncbi:cupin domain-containing protein [Fusibacter bizertensis]|uniref:Cupin domain-containing protein n=1 Tax=Fusibacter bizertensis TaxID=1488331 RepID=A0ABT6NEY7_9FIRM|nr:cupin domain-containing protein [Fusibacter bizertensis]MDH8678958.1 cupin domain-containing protein [Fusibacter bizertensis]
MIVGNFMDLTANTITSPEAKNASMKVLVSPKEGWEGYVMRVVELDPEGYSPKHQHNWPHINYVIEGNGTVLIDETLHELKAGSYAFVPPNTLHQYSNTGTTLFKFICIVPEEGHK